MNLAKAALLVIDLQNEYRPGAAWPVVGYDDVLANTAQLIEAARAAGVPVIHAQAWVKTEERDGYARQEEILTEEFRSAVAGSEGAQICIEVAAQPGDIVIHKQWPSAFRSTDLSQRLTALGVENLLVAGVLTDSCVTASVFDAVYHGFRVWLVKDACGSGTNPMHQTGILNLANRLYGGAVTNTLDACRLMAGDTVTVWQVEGSVPLRFTFENAARLYAEL